MKKQILVIAALMLSSAAISAGAANIKEEKISISDLFDCVKNGNCSEIIHKNDDCPLSGLLGSLIGFEKPDFDLKDFLGDLFDRFPSDNDAETPEFPDEDVTPETPNEPEVPETPNTPVIPEMPDKPEEKPDVPSEDTNSSYESTDSYVNKVLSLVNKYRAQNGLGAVKLDKSLCNAADVRAKEIVSSFSHTRPNGSSCFTVLGELGISYGGAGENIAYGQSSPDEVMTAWMNSSGHRANILNASFDKLGVGVYQNGGTLYWAQMFTY